MKNPPKQFWWWLGGVLAAWLIQRQLNTLVDQKGARQRAIDKELQPFGLN